MGLTLLTAAGSSSCSCRCRTGSSSCSSATASHHTSTTDITTWPVMLRRLLSSLCPTQRESEPVASPTSRMDCVVALCLRKGPGSMDVEDARVIRDVALHACSSPPATASHQSQPRGAAAAGQSRRPSSAVSVSQSDEALAAVAVTRSAEGAVVPLLTGLWCRARSPHCRSTTRCCTCSMHSTDSPKPQAEDTHRQQADSQDHNQGRVRVRGLAPPMNAYGGEWLTSRGCDRP